jgi:hypothetical protein
MDDTALYEVTTRVLDACRTLSSPDALRALELAWLSLAQRARYEALVHPGGFRDERVRQLSELATLTRLVDEEVPTLEMERFLQGTDSKRLFEHTRAQYDAVRAGGAS